MKSVLYLSWIRMKCAINPSVCTKWHTSNFIQWENRRRRRRKNQSVSSVETEAHSPRTRMIVWHLSPNVKRLLTHSLHLNSTIYDLIYVYILDFWFLRVFSLFTFSILYQLRKFPFFWWVFVLWVYFMIIMTSGIWLSMWS